MSAANKKPAADEIVRRFYERVFNQQRLEMLDELVDKDVAFRHLRSGQRDSRDGLKQSLEVLFNAMPHVYAALDNILVSGQTVVAACSISSDVFIWPVRLESIGALEVVHVFTVAEGRILSIDTLGGFEQAEDDDDGDGPGAAPAGPRWVPPLPNRSKVPN